MSSMLHKDALADISEENSMDSLLPVVFINDFIVKVTDKVCSLKNKTSCYLSSKKKKEWKLVIFI